jgi:hypothetical protein
MSATFITADASQDHFVRMRVGGEDMFLDEGQGRVGLTADDRPASRIQPQERLAIIRYTLQGGTGEPRSASACGAIIFGVVNTAVI